MDKLLSIIIPTYNMEAFIGRCLSSLLIEDHKLLNKIEILVINDGSTDSSSSIANSYSFDENKETDTFPEGVLRVIDKDNGNYGSCINIGLKEATGKYIKILDADDWFDTNAFTTFIKSIASLDTDVILSDYMTVDNDGVFQKATHIKVPTNTIFGTEALPADTNIEMYAITYSRQMLLDICYKQTEGISYTDSEWATIPMYYAKKIAYVPTFLYQYVYGREGQTVDFSVAFNKYHHFIKTFTHILKWLETERSKGMACPYIENKIKMMVRCPYHIVLQINNARNDSELKKFDQYIKEHHPSIYKYLDECPIFYGHMKIRYIHRWRHHYGAYKLIPLHYRLVNKLICTFLGKYGA